MYKALLGVSEVGGGLLRARGADAHGAVHDELGVPRRLGPPVQRQEPRRRQRAQRHVHVVH